jgi:hypothetical protein
LPNETKLVIEKEVTESKKIIESKFGKCDYFSYPNGDHDERAVKAINNSKYKLAFSCSIDKINLDTNPYLIPRTYVSGDENLNDFKAKLIGIDNLILGLKNGIKGY